MELNYCHSDDGSDAGSVSSDGEAVFSKNFIRRRRARVCTLRSETLEQAPDRSVVPATILTTVKSARSTHRKTRRTSTLPKIAIGHVTQARKRNGESDLPCQLASWGFLVPDFNPGKVCHT
jgi:hypothetical protein